MNIIAIIKLAITYLPELYSLIKKINDWVQEGVAEAEVKRRLLAFSGATDEASKSKDTSKLEDISIILTSISLVACGAPKINIPAWNGKIYVGDSRSQAMVRTQDHESIPASDPKFDEMFGMTEADFNSFYSTFVLGCAQWKKGMPLEAASKALLRHRDAYQRMKKIEMGQ